MSDATWYYRKLGERFGPLTTEAMCELFAVGRLPVDTPVWVAAMKKWLPACDLKGFRDAAANAPVRPAPAAGGPGVPLSGAAADDATEPQFDPHPWLRFFARTGDRVLWLVTPMMVLIAFSARQGPRISPLLLWVECMLAWPLIEALLLARWGTTPGKAALGIHVQRLDGRNPSFAQAFTRSFKVLFAGEGLNIPLLGLVTQVIGYLTLSQQGATSWDRDSGLRVRHAPCGAAKVISLLLLCWVYVAVLMFVAMSAAGAFAASARHRAAVAASAPPPVVPPHRMTVMQGNTPVEFIDGVDPRIAYLTGHSHSKLNDNYGKGRIEIQVTLRLKPDRTYQQTVTASAPTGVASREATGNSSGTWELFGDQLRLNCTASTNADHPTGTYTYWVRHVREWDFSIAAASTPPHCQGLPGPRWFYKDASVADLR